MVRIFFSVRKFPSAAAVKINQKQILPRRVYIGLTSRYTHMRGYVQINYNIIIIIFFVVIII